MIGPSKKIPFFCLWRPKCSRCMAGIRRGRGRIRGGGGEPMGRRIWCMRINRSRNMGKLIITTILLGWNLSMMKNNPKTQNPQNNPTWSQGSSMLKKNKTIQNITIVNRNNNWWRVGWKNSRKHMSVSMTYQYNISNLNSNLLLILLFKKYHPLWNQVYSS